MKQIAIILSFLVLSSCTTSYKKAIEELQNMPPADYSYIVQPEFQLSKEASEEKFKEFYNAEELKIGASGTHTYDKETKEQIDEKFWLKSVILNSNQVTNINDEESTKQLAKKYAEQVLKEVTNSNSYGKIEIQFMQQWNDGQVKTIKRNFFFQIPSLEETNW